MSVSLLCFGKGGRSGQALMKRDSGDTAERRRYGQGQMTMRREEQCLFPKGTHDMANTSECRVKLSPSRFSLSAYLELKFILVAREELVFTITNLAQLKDAIPMVDSSEASGRCFIP